MKIMGKKTKMKLRQHNERDGGRRGWKGSKEGGREGRDVRGGVEGELQAAATTITV